MGVLANRLDCSTNDLTTVAVNLRLAFSGLQQVLPHVRLVKSEIVAFTDDSEISEQAFVPVHLLPPWLYRVVTELHRISLSEKRERQVGIGSPMVGGVNHVDSARLHDNSQHHPLTI